MDYKEAAAAIGAYYLHKHKGDYKACELEINNLHITKITVDEKLPHSRVIEITTGRPGLLIGKRGTNIEALEKFVGVKIKTIEDRDPLYCYLIPTPPYDNYDLE